MVSSFLNRPPARRLSRPFLTTHPPCHSSWSSYPRGYPRPGRVSTLLNQTYSVPDRLVHACLQVTEQVWQPMHLSRFITIAIWAMTFTGNEPPTTRWSSLSRPSVLNLLRALADDGDLVALVARGPEVVEREGQLGVAADQVAGLDQQPGQRVVDAAALARRLRERDVDQPVLGVVHVHRPFGHAVRDDRAGDHDAVAVHRLDPVVVPDADLRGVPVAHPDVLAAP